MAKPVFDKILANTLAFEGGFAVDHAGPTNKGVTQTSYDSFRTAKKQPKQPVKSISDDEVKELYQKEYFESQKYDKLPHGVSGLMFDFGVNSGPARANKILQKIVGEKTDGIIGPHTLFAVERYIVDNGEEALKQKITQARTQFVNFLAEKDPGKYKPFLGGWLNRINEVNKRYAENKQGDLF